jgi:hypothetical protein
MKCTRLFVSFVEERGTLFPLVSDSPPGRKSRRTHLFTGEARGVAISTETNLTPAGLPVMDRRAFDAALLLARREALIATARHLRNNSRCREASSVLEEAKAVTNACLAMGISNEQA